nr:photosystem I assembly protein Ycf4 [Coronilla valentina subsp. glauca]
MTWISEDTWQSEEVRIDFVTGCRKPRDFFWAFMTLLGSVGFLLVAASSYLHRNFLSFISAEFDPELIRFLPQGATITVYGTAGLFVSLFLWLTIFWNVGSGYDLFDKKRGIVCIFRYGFPGKNRRIFIRVLMNDIQSFIIQSKMENKKEGRYLRSGVLYMQTREQGAIPLTPVVDSWNPPKIAQKAGDLSKLLRVPIEIF